MRSACLLLALACLVVAPGQQRAAADQARGTAGQSRGAAPTAPAPIPPALEEAADAASKLPRLHSLLVSQRGTLLFERYYNGRRATQLANVKSVSKSIISALVGLAIEQKAIADVRQPIGQYFPDLLRGPEHAAKQRITVEDLLTMRSGLESTSSRNYGAWVTSKHWVRHALTRELEQPPGTAMEYSTGNTHLLSAILTTVTKKSTWQFAQEALAKPLGFSLARWPQDPQGIYFGGNDMLLTPRQMLAIGELYRNRGRAGGVQIIPEHWIEASLVPRGRSYWSDQQYGYGWWLRELGGHASFFAWGYGGQYIFVVPRLDLVIVTTSATTVGEERRSHRRSIVDIIEQSIVPALAAPQSGGISPR